MTVPEEGTLERRMARRELCGYAQASRSVDEFVRKAPQRLLDSVSDRDFKAIVDMFIENKNWSKR